MYPRPFDYVAATSIEEAVRELGNAEFGKVMSGGMSLIPMMKLRLLSPEVVVDIGRIEGLRQVPHGGQKNHNGGLVPHEQTGKGHFVPLAVPPPAGWTGDRQV